MWIPTREIFNELQKILSEEAIFKGCEITKEHFMKNLEKEESSESDQAVIKQHFLLLNMVPINWTEASNSNLGNNGLN